MSGRNPSKNKGDAPSKFLGRDGIDIPLLRERLVSKVEIDAAGCWLWTAYIRPQGYGQIGLPHGGKVIDAHRASYLAFHGDLLAGLAVCHHCDVRACINPEHIYLGTPKDNARDAWERGRMRRLAGLETSNARLTTAQVEEIRRRYVREFERGTFRGGWRSNAAELAEEFGITSQYVGQLAKGTWRKSA